MLITDPASPEFDSYASVSDLQAFATARGYEVPADAAECENLLVQAMRLPDGSGPAAGMATARGDS